MQPQSLQPLEQCPTCGHPCEPPNPQRILDSLPLRGYVRQKLLIQSLLPFSAATLWRKVRAKEFPAPHKLSARITAWRVEDVRAWFEKQSLAQ